MKKLFLVLAGFTFLSTGAQTVDDVIQKYAAGIGGLEAFNRIQTVKMTGTVTAQGTDLPITVQIINGKGDRTDVEVMGSLVINAYKDGKGWTQNPFAGSPTPTEVTAEALNDLKQESMLAPALIDYKARNYDAALEGQEDVEGKKAYKIKMTSKDDGGVSHYYIDATDYMLVKSTTDRVIQGQTATVEIWFSDLKQFGNIKIFMSRIQKVNGEELQVIKFDTLELNAPVDEKIFDMPRQ